MLFIDASDCAARRRLHIRCRSAFRWSILKTSVKCYQPRTNMYQLLMQQRDVVCCTLSEPRVALLSMFLVVVAVVVAAVVLVCCICLFVAFVAEKNLVWQLVCS